MKKAVNCILLLGFFFLGGCLRNVYFNEFEESLLRIYNEGDTLIFESDKGVRDTSYIVLKDIGYASWNPENQYGRYRRLSGTIYYGSNRNRDDNMFFKQIITLEKKNPDTTWVFLSHKNVSVSEYYRDFSLESFDRFKVEEGLYRFKVSSVRPDSTIESQTQLYFNLEYGVVKYITADGEVWQRINIEK